MPILTRSNVSATKNTICIQTETPSIPKNDGIFENLRSKKRKLDQELSRQCWKKQLLQASCPRKVCKRNKSNAKITKVVFTEHNMSEAKNKVIGKRHKDYEAKIQNNVLEGKKRSFKSKAIEPSETSSVFNISKMVKSSKNGKTDYNQRRVNKAIQDISSTSYNDQYLNPQVIVDQFASLENSKVSKKSVGKQCSTEVSETKGPYVQEKTSGEEDYQRKYFELLDMMKDLQEKFLISQQDIEEHVAANDLFVERMKVILEEKNNELVLAKEELKLCKVRNSKLENSKKAFEQDFKASNEKVEETTMANKALWNSRAEERATQLQCLTDDHNAAIELYKLLTGLSLKKVTRPYMQDNGFAACETFHCSIKTTGTEEIKFVLSQDREFAEIEYQPLAWSSREAKEYPSFPEYLQEQIFFADEQAPKFLLRLLRAVHEPEKHIA